MNIITKNQIVTVTTQNETYEGRVIAAHQAHSFMGQFIVVSLEAPIGPKMTKCFIVNGSCKPFGYPQSIAKGVQ